MELRLLADAEQSEATVHTGAPTAADWVAVETRQVRRDARSDLRHAQRLEHHDVLSTAMAAVAVNVAQSRAIVAALDRLPRTGAFAVTAEQRLAAEKHLVDLAAHHDAKELRILGRRVFEVIAPDVAEQFEGRALEREEAQALRRTTLVAVGGRRRHLPRPLPHPGAARADADQDDPRPGLTQPGHHPSAPPRAPW